MTESPTRPRVRGDCEAGPRPCPWHGCKYHLKVHVDPRGKLKELEFNEGDETCALDVADQGGVTLEEVSKMLGVSRARVGQIEARALNKLRRALQTTEHGGERSRLSANVPWRSQGLDDPPWEPARNDKMNDTEIHCAMDGIHERERPHALKDKVVDMSTNQQDVTKGVPIPHHVATEVIRLGGNFAAVKQAAEKYSVECRVVQKWVDEHKAKQDQIERQAAEDEAKGNARELWQWHELARDELGVAEAPTPDEARKAIERLRESVNDRVEELEAALAIQARDHATNGDAERVDALLSLVRAQQRLFRKKTRLLEAAQDHRSAVDECLALGLEV